MHAGDHPDHRQHQWQGQQDGCCQPDALPAKRIGLGLLVRSGPGLNQMRAIARLLHGGDEVGRIERLRQPHARLLGRQIDSGPVHARHLGKGFLDATDAGRAAHPLDGEVICLFNAHDS